MISRNTGSYTPDQVGELLIGTNKESGPPYPLKNTNTRLIPRKDSSAFAAIHPW